jgi:cell volume regulation protein A
LSIDTILLVGAALILASIAIAKLSDNLGVPALLLFLGIGMLAGAEGPGGIVFSDAGLAQSIGIIALVFILFAGGLDTRWHEVRAVLWQAASLATIGVLMTAGAVGLFAAYVLHLSPMTGLLLGAIVSSTDAAAVFSVLRSRNISLKSNLKPLLELESGSNDPMAVFLTVGLLELVTRQDVSAGSFAMSFVVEMGLGAALGVGLGKLLVIVLNRLKLNAEGIYPVLALAYAAFVYALTATLGGSGFLAVYLAGMTAGSAEFVQKRSLLRFFDGLAWLSQIAMFLTLGLLVDPSHIVPVIGIGLLASVFLIVVARPLSVFVSLAASSLGWREKTLVSWVGLRGAVPIILATFPLLAGVPDAAMIFNVVFFIVLTSTLVQAWGMSAVAKALGLSSPVPAVRRYPIEFAPVAGVDTELVDLIVPYNAEAAGRSVIELGLPRDCLVVLISRDDTFLVPSGGTILQEGDTVLVLVNKTNLPAVRGALSRLKD